MSTKPTTSVGIAPMAAALAIVSMAAALAAGATAPTWGLVGGLGMSALIIFQRTRTAQVVLIVCGFIGVACAQSYSAKTTRVDSRALGGKILAMSSNPATTNFSNGLSTK